MASETKSDYTMGPCKVLYFERSSRDTIVKVIILIFVLLVSSLVPVITHAQNTPTFTFTVQPGQVETVSICENSCSGGTSASFTISSTNGVNFGFADICGICSGSNPTPYFQGVISQRTDTVPLSSNNLIISYGVMNICSSSPITVSLYTTGTYDPNLWQTTFQSNRPNPEYSQFSSYTQFANLKNACGSAPPSDQISCTIGVLGDGLCLPVEHLQTYTGSVTVTDETTGTQRSGMVAYFGDTVQTGPNSVAGICPISTCTPSLLRVEANQDTSITNFAAVWPGTASPTDPNNVQLWPNNSNICTKVFDEPTPLSCSTKILDIIRAISTDFFRHDFTQAPLYDFAGSETSGVALEFVGLPPSVTSVVLAAQLYQFNTVLHQSLKILTMDTLAHTESDPEYTITVGTNGTLVSVFSGTVRVQSLTTTQLISLNASQQVFIPRDEAKASSQVMNQSVRSFDPQAASRWWNVAQNPFSAFLNSVIQAVSSNPFLVIVAVLVLGAVSVSALKRRSKKQTPATIPGSTPESAKG